MISIHIVSYNKSAYLINAVQSVLNQKLGYGKYEILVFEGSQSNENKDLFVDYYCELIHSETSSIGYYHWKGNYGLSKALNYLYSQQDEETKYIIELNEDMFFGSNAIPNLVSALEQNPSLTLACSNMVNGNIYNKTEPKKEDVDDFARRFSSEEPLTVTPHASNLPWAIRAEDYQQLCKVDVWNSGSLPENEYKGIWDESIDPLAGWCADWDIHNRVYAMNGICGIVNSAHVYHYDHVSGSELDQNNPGWTEKPVANYIAKYGNFSKGLPLVRKEKPLRYPLK